MRGRLPRSAGSAVLAVLAVGCGSGANGTVSTLFSGRVTSDGSSTVFPIAQAVAEEFHRLHPKVRVSVAVSGTSGGFHRLCNGEIDIANASRPILGREREQCEANGVEPIEIALALDGLSVVVNPANHFADCLTLDELRRIWEPDSGVRYWSDVRAGFPKEEMLLYGPGPSSGTFDHFTATVIGEAGASRAGYQASEDDHVVVQGVWGDRFSLGYLGYAYYAASTDKLRLVAIDSGDGCVLPSRNRIERGEYAPLSRPLLAYVDEASLSKPAVRAYVHFMLENAAELVASTGYLPLAAEDYLNAAARLSSPATAAR